MRDNNKKFYRIIYKDSNNEVHFKDYETKKDFLLDAPYNDIVFISARRFKGETSRDVTYLFEKFFEQVAK